MGAFKRFAVVSAGLLSVSGSVLLGGWSMVCYQPTGDFALAYNADWKPVIKVANDRVFDLKVEAGVVPAPLI